MSDDKFLWACVLAFALACVGALLYGSVSADRERALAPTTTTCVEHSVLDSVRVQ